MSHEWIQRPSSAQGNLFSHPCYQSSLLDDGHAPGTVNEWRKLLGSNKPQLRMANINRNAEDYDQNLEVKSYFQSVRRCLFEKDVGVVLKMFSLNIYDD
jgi:hypothetical protein